VQSGERLAWQFWTNVSNWPVVDYSVESAVLDGPFRSGAKFITNAPWGSHQRTTRGCPRRARRCVIIHIPGAALRCVWNLRMPEADNATHAASHHRGEKARDYQPALADLERTIPRACSGLLKQSSSSP